jgi:hypothetical protein
LEVKKWLKLIFEGNAFPKEFISYEIYKRFGVVLNIKGAWLNKGKAEMEVELRGKKGKVEDAIRYLKEVCHVEEGS